jgi:hypothetical protein
MYTKRQSLSRGGAKVPESVNDRVVVYTAWRQDADQVAISSALRFKGLLRRSEPGGRESTSPLGPRALLGFILGPAPRQPEDPGAKMLASDPRGPIFGGNGRVIWPPSPEKVPNPGGAGRQASSGLISSVIEPTAHPAPQPPTTSMVQSRVDVYGSLPAVRSQDRVQLAVKSFCSALSRLFAAFRYDLRC